MNEKSVLISIRPQWCELIASGKKTLEIRKKRPKIETPFKCYIYCTVFGPVIWTNEKPLNGKVMGEFVCDFIRGEPEVVYEGLCDVMLCEESCLSPKEIISYAGNGVIYSWHISALKIYDKPMELSEFGLKRPPQSWQYLEATDE